MRAWVLGGLLALIAGQAWAEVTVTFYAHPGARAGAHACGRALGCE